MAGSRLSPAEIPRHGCCLGRRQTPGPGPPAQKPKQRVAGDRAGTRAGGTRPPGIVFFFLKYKVFWKKRKKNLYKNLFTYKILKKVQGKTQCEGRAQIRSVCVCVCPCVHVCTCVSVSVCGCVVGASARVAHRGWGESLASDFHPGGKEGGWSSSLEGLQLSGTSTQPGCCASTPSPGGRPWQGAGAPSAARSPARTAS